LLVAVGLSNASAADLSKIDRTLPDEPKYSTAAPKYCLLAFGPDAKTTVWLVRDGNVMHVFASPDGKSAKVWRQVNSGHVFEIGDIWEDERTCHKRLRCYAYQRDRMLSILIDGKRQIAGEDRRGKLEFAASPKDAPVVHFNGPLVLDLYYEQEPLRTGTTVDLSAVIGTPGVGPGTMAVVFCDSYPKNAWPTAVIEYPAKEGGKPIVETVRLNEN
jgi:hypothetical protein